jgi:hypothetical protein
MSRTSPDTVYKQIAANPKAPQKTRLAALAAILKPSLAYLSRLAADPSNPVRVRMAAAGRVDALLLIRKQLAKGIPWKR